MSQSGYFFRNSWKFKPGMITYLIHTSKKERSIHLSDSVDSTDLNYWTNRIKPKLNVLNYCKKLDYICIGLKLNPGVSELDFWADRYFALPWRDSNSHLRPLGHIKK